MGFSGGTVARWTGIRLPKHWAESVYRYSFSDVRGRKWLMSMSDINSLHGHNVA